MVKPISLRIRNNQVNARARALLRRIDAEAAARRSFKHHAAKAFLATSEMRSTLDKLTPPDRARWQDEIKRIEATLLKITQGLR
jgi:hypothetical protein